MPAGDSARRLAAGGVAEQALAMRAGEVSAAALCAATLERIAAVQPRLNAFRRVFTDTAPAAAAAFDADPSRRGAPLGGVPVAVKDNAAVAGEQALLGTGSPEPVADRDDELIRRLREAGAILVGLTHLPELALWAATESRWHGITRNPWDLDRAPGGSSGGSAAAVAAGVVPAAHATDGLGSIRIPASACGLVGLKPTHGLVPLTGPDPDHWLGMSHAGFLTRTVADTAILLDAVLSGRRFIQAATTPPTSPLRIAVSDRPWLPVRVDPAVRAGLEASVAALADLGHRLTRRHPPYGRALSNAGTVRYLAGLSRDRAALADPKAVEPRTRRLAAIGARIPARTQQWARRTGERFGQRMEAFFDDVDLLLTPTMPRLPARAGELSRRGLPRTLSLMIPFAGFTGPWNGCGFPAMSVPAATTPDGLPVGVQLVAPPGREELLLSLGGQLETATGWPARRPDLPELRQ